MKLFFLFLLLIIVFLYITLPKKIESFSNQMKKYKVIVGLSSIPGREKTIVKTIDSLLNQTMPPDKIAVNLCQNYKRFPFKTYDMSYLQKFRDSDIVDINFNKNDYGPITKLFGVIDNYPLDENTIVTIVDDDMTYRPFMIEEIHKNYKKNKNRSYSYCKFFNETNKCHIGQGADSFSFNPTHLVGIKEYFNKCIDFDKRLFFHDDLVISKYLAKNNRKLKKLETKEGRIYLKQNSVEPLNKITGDNSRYNLNRIKIPDNL